MKIDKKMKKANDPLSSKRPHTSNSTHAVGSNNNNANSNDLDGERIQRFINILGNAKSLEVLAAEVERQKEFKLQVKKKYDDKAKWRKLSPCKYYEGRRNYMLMKSIGAPDVLNDAVYALLDADHHDHDCICRRL